MFFLYFLHLLQAFCIANLVAISIENKSTVGILFAVIFFIFAGFGFHNTMQSRSSLKDVDKSG